MHGRHNGMDVKCATIAPKTHTQSLAVVWSVGAMAVRSLSLCVAALLAAAAHAFYLPGVAPVEYLPNTRVSKGPGARAGWRKFAAIRCRGSQCRAGPAARTHAYARDAHILYARNSGGKF